LKEGITVYKGYRVIKLLGVPLLIAIAISLVWGGIAFAGKYGDELFKRVQKSEYKTPSLRR